jgi:hypothetical protein
VDPTRDRLAALPDPVRADFARLVLAAMDDVRRRWRARGRLRARWCLLDGDGAVRVAGLRPGEVSPYAVDGVHHRAPVDRIEAELGEHRAVALVFGSHWRSARLPLTRTPDRWAVVELRHRTGAGARVELPFTRQRRLRERVRFDDDLRGWLVRAAG